MLAANGRFDAAALELDAIAEDGVGGDRDRLRDPERPGRCGPAPRLN